MTWLCVVLLRSCVTWKLNLRQSRDEHVTCRRRTGSCHGCCRSCAHRVTKTDVQWLNLPTKSTRSSRESKRCVDSSKKRSVIEWKHIGPRCAVLVLRLPRKIKISYRPDPWSGLLELTELRHGPLRSGNSKDLILSFETICYRRVMRVPWTAKRRNENIG